MLTDTAARRLLMPEDLKRPFRYATRRNPALATRGGKVAVLATELGRPLKPHQQYIADVATELNPPGSRLMFRYQMVVVNEPRQVGKTTLLRPVFLDRCLTTPNTAAFMTAQLGKYASERWEDLVDDYEQSPIFAEFVNIKRGKGDQKCIFPNESFIAPFPPQRDALHGESPDIVAVDEGWAFSEEEGRDLTRAYRPAMITRTRRQVWILSAAGTAESEWWDDLVKAGRESVNDPNSTIAYFEHSADEDADPYDPETWEFHPGLEGLITLDELAEEAKPENNTHADFLRGFLNISTKQRDKTVIDLDQWDSLAAELTAPDMSTVALAYDVAIDRSSASIWGAWIDEDGNICLHVMETRPESDWLAPRIKALHDAGLTGIAADDGGPARVITEQLRRHNIDVTTANGRQAATAWEEFKAAVAAGTVRHDGSPALRDGFEVAAERHMGDAVTLSRRHSLGPIDAPIAAITAAWFAHRNQHLIPIF